jgi:hypothetical protein
MLTFCEFSFRCLRIDTQSRRQTMDVEITIFVARLSFKCAILRINIHQHLAEKDFVGAGKSIESCFERKWRGKSDGRRNGQFGAKRRTKGKVYWIN